VLDVGCAKGYLVKLLRELKLVEAWGVDFSTYAVENCPNEIKSYLHRVNVENDALPFISDFFDLTVSFSTFEHLRSTRLPLTLSEIRRVLKNNGLLIINVPNPLNKVEAEKPEHITMLSKKKWIRLVENSGFHYRPKLSNLFDNLRVNEIAALYISLHNSFQLMGIHFSFPKGTETLVTYLIVLKRKFLPPTFSLIFSKA